MAENTTKTDEQKSQETNPGTPETAQSADLAVAEKAGISEGEVKALRDNAGINQLPGSDSDVHAWSLSDAGKKWAEGEKDREKSEAEYKKAYEAQFDKKGLTEAESKYFEAVKG